MSFCLAKPRAYSSDAITHFVQQLRNLVTQSNKTYTSFKESLRYVRMWSPEGRRSFAVLSPARHTVPSRNKTQIARIVTTLTFGLSTFTLHKTKVVYKVHNVCHYFYTMHAFIPHGTTINSIPLLINFVTSWLDQQETIA